MYNDNDRVVVFAILVGSFVCAAYGFSQYNTYGHSTHRYTATITSSQVTICPTRHYEYIDNYCAIVDCTFTVGNSTNHFYFKASCSNIEMCKTNYAEGKQLTLYADSTGEHVSLSQPSRVGSLVLGIAGVVVFVVVMALVISGS